MHNKFDFDNVEDFDKHIDLSIPNYQGLHDVFKALFMEYMPPDGICVDIGCSTGHFLNEVSGITNGEYIGSDLVQMSDEYNFNFIQKDCLEVLQDIKNINVILSMFTLQFLGAVNRKKVIQEITRLVSGGAIFLVAEKIYCNNPKVNSVLNREHLRQKRKGFSDTEILDKDYSLFGKMFCLELQEIEQELSSIGILEQVWQSYNFKGWVVLPKNNINQRTYK
tara:strand:+ start:639 stop:1304 length:666 start_codon:yes stop_codon:yes gene_type:complete